ncbi:MAG: hypothetical protein ACRD1T_26015, partial [Acidimicrobiia bacterium]
SKVRSGGKVIISGAISGASSCMANQAVKLKSKKLSGGRFRNIGSANTNGDGEYSFTIHPTKSKRYKAVAPAGGACDKATSGTIKIRVT